VTTCVALGIWQIARLHQKQQFNTAVRAGLSSPLAPLGTLFSDGVEADALRYRRSEATGLYDTAREFVLYGRTQSSQAGNHLLTPLRLADGRAILVDRGWVPLDVDEPGASGVAPPTGDVRVQGVLFPSEGDPPGVPGQSIVKEATVSKVDLGRIQSQLPYQIAPDYLLLQRQSPAQSSRFPEPAPLPELSEGPHLSYAVQWFTFAAIAVAGFGVLALRERRDPRATDDDQVG
jgi:surfeit locus 1 family protein